MDKFHYANSADDLLTPEQLGEISGLEFIQGIAEGRYPAPPISRTLNFWLESAQLGEAIFVGAPKFDAMNPIGSVHGGWFGAILDSCMACAVQTTLPKGQGYTTLEYKVNIIRAITPDSGMYRAIGSVDHAGRRTGVATGRLVGVDDGKTYATGSTTCITLDLTKKR